MQQETRVTEIHIPPRQNTCQNSTLHRHQSAIAKWVFQIYDIYRYCEQ